MAMIKCPECGNMVSDKAPTCIYCGTPLQVNKSVKIKIPRFATGMMNQKASEEELSCNDRILWKGFSGQVASFEIETTSILNVEVIPSSLNSNFSACKENLSGTTIKFLKSKFCEI